MKLIPATLLLVVGQAADTAAIDSASESIPSDSVMGQRLLSKARRLENNNNNGNNGDMTWASGYSIKFEKCATTNEYYGGYFGGNNNGQQQQNNNNNRANYAGLYEQRLVHFKLCPTKTCGYGCSGGGDYVIDMNEYVRTYIEYQQELVEAKCEAVREACNCEDTDDNEVCESTCLATAGLTEQCAQQEGQNNNNNNGQTMQFNLQEAVECRRLEVDEDAAAYAYGSNVNNYYYNNNGNNQNNNQRIEFFMGPYCAAAGRSIFLGVFMDETCSFSAPDGIYKKLSGGKALPYSTTSLIGHECMSCMDTAADAAEDANGENQAATLEICQNLYQASGKCEKNMNLNGAYPTTGACDFIKGLNHWGKTRIAAEYKEFARHITANVLAGVFACTTVLFGGVSYFIHRRLMGGGRKSVGLVADADGAMA